MRVKTKKDYRARRHMRLRKKISGTGERPRMSVFKSNKNIAVQCIDDVAGRTIVSASTLSKDGQGASDGCERARMVGKSVAEKLLAQNIDTGVFDNGGFGYNGRIKELADAARESGLKF
jgi:large subunit ribosomal protein L18